MERHERNLRSPAVPAPLRPGRNRHGIIYGFQDATPLGEDPERLDLFASFGLRNLQLTCNRRNLLGDGCLEPADAGVSRLSHRAVERINELGLLADLSHCGHRTTTNAIAASKQPALVGRCTCGFIEAVLE